MSSIVPFRLLVEEHPLGQVGVSALRGGSLEARERALVRAIDTGAS